MSLFSPDLSVTGSSSPLKSNRKPATGGNPKKKTPVSSYVYITILVCSLQVHRNFENLFYSSWRGVRRWSIEYQGSWHRDNYSQRLLHLINECLFFFSFTGHSLSEILVMQSQMIHQRSDGIMQHPQAALQHSAGKSVWTICSPSAIQTMLCEMH